jgi:hypothetical protein
MYFYLQNITAVTYFIIMFVLVKSRRVRVYANSPPFCAYMTWTDSVMRRGHEYMAINTHAVVTGRDLVTRPAKLIPSSPPAAAATVGLELV